MPIPFDYETLRLIWWLLLGVLLVGFLTRAARPELTRLGLLKEDAGV